MKRVLRRILAAIDIILAAILAPFLAISVVVYALPRRRRRAEGRKLLVIDSAYSLHTIRSRGLERFLVERDLAGYFDHVWTFHPLVGASPDEPTGSDIASFRSTNVTPRHTMLEGHVGLLSSLRAFPALGLLIAQFDAFLRVDRLVRKERIAVIRAHDPMYLGLFAWVVSRSTRRPFLIFIQGNYDYLYDSTGQLAYPRLLRSRWIEERLSRWILRRADLVAGGNQNNLEYGLANGAPADRSTLFRIGRSIDPYHFGDPASRPVPEDLPAPPGKFILYVGRLEILKHPDDVIRALAVIRARHPGIHAVLVGDGGMRDDLMILAKELGVEDAVHFTGNRPQRWIADLLPSAAVIMSPLTGRALVEAALSARPIVAYDIEWHSELIVNEATGYLVPYRDTTAFGTRASDLISDPALAREIGAAGRDAARRMMDPERLLRHEREQYETLIARLDGHRSARSSPETL